MLFWLCLVILIIGIGLIVAGCINWNYKKNKLFNFLYDNDEILKLIGGIITFISGFVIAIMLVVLPCMYKGELAQAAKEITQISERVNVFIDTDIRCKKWSGKVSNYRELETR